MTNSWSMTSGGISEGFGCPASKQVDTRRCGVCGVSEPRVEFGEDRGAGALLTPFELARLGDLELLDLELFLHGLIAAGERGRDRLETHALARHESQLGDF